MSSKTCSKCGEVKPLAQFTFDSKHADGRSSHCRACRADKQAERRKAQPQEERSRKMAAYRAGIRKDTCAICGVAIEGEGICGACDRAVEQLGGIEGLKKAIRTVRFLTPEE